jgi:hypothetical protein
MAVVSELAAGGERTRRADGERAGRARVPRRPAEEHDRRFDDLRPIGHL